MQIRALYDRQGRILAAVQMQATDSGGEAVPTPQPRPKRGQRVGEFTVPRECAHLSFSQVCAELVVPRGKGATLVAKSRPGRKKGASKRP